MKRPVALALLFAAALPAFAAGPKWATYVAKGDGFSILMPGPTATSTQSSMGVETHMFISTVQPFVCVASRTVLTPKLAPADIAMMKGAMRTSMLASSRSKATGERAATYAGVTGQLTTFKTAAGGTGATWIAQKGNVVYFLTIANQGGETPAEIERFFRSFSIR